MAPPRAISKVFHTARKKSFPSPGESLLRLFGFSRTHFQSSFLAAPCAVVRHASKPLEKGGVDRQVLPSSTLYSHHGGRICLLARSFGCSSSVLWTHEVEEEFDAEPCKHVRSYSNHACSDNYVHKLSVRIERPMAGILDKELLRKRRTQPFTEKSLGVGLYRDKLRNRRSFSTAAMASSDDEGQLRGSHTLKTQAVKPTDTSCQKHKSAKCDIKLQSPEADEGEEEIGVLDSDSEEEEQDCCDKNKQGISSLIKEESLGALEVSLREMEASLASDDTRIGTTCLRLAQLYDSSDEEPEKILSYAHRALKILEPSKEPSFETAMCYHVIGSAYYKMDDSEKAITYLEHSADMLEKMGDAGANEKSIGTIKYAVQVLLGHSRMALGKEEEGLKNYQNGVVINERMLEPGNPDLARSYQQAAEAFTEAEKYEDALTLCMKALPIYENYYGSASFEVAVLRRLMAMNYDHLEDFEKLLAQHEVIRPILVKLGKKKEVASLDLSSGEALISLERYKDAVVKLKDVVKETKETSRFHAHALVLIGKAYAELKEGKNAAKYCKKALNALKGKKFSLEAGSSLMELGSVYQQLNELEQAMAASKKALGIFEQHPEQIGTIADIEGQIGLLYIFMGKVEEGLPYLEKSGSKIEGIYGADSDELLAVYNHTAIAYLELGRFEEALVKFEAARVIAVKSLGPEDGDTIAIYANLVNTYAGLERFEKAIECQKHVVDAVRKGNSQYDITLEEAEKKLKELMAQVKSSGRSQGG
eukprot:c13670_g1_i1 orf=182-2467(+)